MDLIATGRVSALQRRIILAIAKYIFDHDGDIYLMWVTYQDLYYLVYTDHLDDWQAARREYLSRRACLSRSIHDLIDNKGLVQGLALAWMLKDNVHEDLISWQGGGRDKRITNTRGMVFKMDTPNYRMFGLTEAGIMLAKELGTDVTDRLHD